MNRYDQFKSIPADVLKTYFQAVWAEALVALGGASTSEMQRDSFIHAQLSDDYPASEYRFGGHFGFGGKLRTRHRLVCTVDHYPEDHTAERKAQEAAVNEKLAELWQQHLASYFPS